MLDQTAIRNSLEEQLSELLERGERIEAHQQNLEREVPKDWEEEAAFRTNDEVVDRLEDHTRRQVASIRAALRRMDEGTWGECDRCGGRISDQRLTALPTAVLCLGCASDGER